MKQFFTTYTVASFLVSGIILVIIGQTAYLNQIFPYFSTSSPIHTIIKSIGATLIGSGVFTAVIKSKEYTEVFSNIIGEIVWSKKFVERRDDKKKMWSMISRLIYQEKFPLISDEIENIITSQYFPTDHDYYLEDYDLVINITDVNNDFWQQSETVKVILKPVNSEKEVAYDLKCAIELPFDKSIQDITDVLIDEVSVNGEIQQLHAEPCVKSNIHCSHALKLLLHESKEYLIIIKRRKIMCKKTNPDKNFFSKSIIKNASLTVILDAGIHIVFHKMGTIKDFVSSEEQVNKTIKMINWSYKGVILPQQGYTLILK